MAQPPHEPPHRRVAHGLARHMLQVASPLGGAVAAGRSARSASSSRPIVSSLFGGLPGGFLGASEPPWRSILAKRFTEERLTPKRPAASLLIMPRLRASTIFRLRSSE